MEGLDSLKKVNTESLLKKYLTRDIINEYKAIATPAPVEANLLDCVQSGFENPSAVCGLYAADPECYDLFNKLFDPTIRSYHEQLENANEQLQPATEFGNVNEIENLDPSKTIIRSTRIRIGRNLEGLPFYPKLTEKQFLEIADKVKGACETLSGDLSGVYYPLGSISAESQREMVSRHILFNRNDENLEAAGCYRFWPIGRGLFLNQLENFMVWVNEEDHLRIISLVKFGYLGKFWLI